MVSDFLLSGKSALVTGAAQGIGKAIADALAERGANVGIVDLKGAENTAAALGSRFGEQRFTHYELDVRDEAAVRACVADFVSDHGRIDVLVNNAGTATRKPIDEISADEWDRDLQTNLYGTYHFCKAALYPHMLDAKSGAIINISSISGINGGAVSEGEAGARSGPAYAASKGGIIALTKWIAKEVGPKGVTCNSVAPGPVESALTAGQEYDLSGQSIKRMGHPSDIAAAVAYLASPGAAFVTGQILRVDGGAVIA